MDITKVLLIGILVVLVGISLLPVQIAFVESGSMRPVIDTGDAFIINTLDGVNYQEGDIITFSSDEREKLTTHRIVDLASEGYITKGDANSATDQEVGLDPVNKNDIRGKVIEINNKPVKLPYIGYVASLVLENRIISSIAIVALLLLDLNSGRNQSTTNRKEKDEDQSSEVRIAIYLIVLSIAFLLTVNMIAASEVRQNTLVVDEDAELDSTKFVRPNETVVRNVRIQSSSHPFLLEDEVKISGANSEVVEFKLDRRESNTRFYNLTYKSGPIEQESVVPVSIKVYSYPNTLPDSFIQGLHEQDPILASLLTVSVTVTPVLIMTLLLVTRSKYRSRVSIRYRDQSRERY